MYARIILEDGSEVTVEDNLITLSRDIPAELRIQFLGEFPGGWSHWSTPAISIPPRFQTEMRQRAVTYSSADVEDALLAVYPESYKTMLREGKHIPAILKMAAEDLFLGLCEPDQVSPEQEHVIRMALRDLGTRGQFEFTEE